MSDQAKKDLTRLYMAKQDYLHGMTAEMIVVPPLEQPDQSANDQSDTQQYACKKR